MPYLLDTNIVSDLIRNPSGRAQQRIEGLGEETALTSAIVSAELRFGAERRGSARLARQLELVLGSLQVLPFGPPADVAYAEIRAALERAGTLIGPNDLLIAAQCLALDLVLVTDNTREFSRVPGLAVENWLR